MNRLQKLINLNTYLNSFRIAGSDDELAPIITTAQADATSKLAYLDGQRLIAAHPECNQSGNDDVFSSVVSTAFFVLEKSLAQAKTDDLEQEQYDRLLRIASDIIDKVAADITASGCNTLSGLSLNSVKVVPEASLFGGWLGWSVEMDFD
ncbi:MAG: hypothetical protein WCR48_00820 [Bacteroidales bacterium]